MRGATPPLPQYAFMAWCSVKAQGHLYLYPFVFRWGKFQFSEWATTLHVNAGDKNVYCTVRPTPTQKTIKQLTRLSPQTSAETADLFNQLFKSNEAVVRTGRPWLDSQQGQVGNFVSMPPLRPGRLTQPLLNGYRGGYFLGGKEAGAWSWPLTSF
jgi:hypothetical protein